MHCIFIFIPFNCLLRPLLIPWFIFMVNIKRYLLFTVNFYFDIFPNPLYIQSPIEDFFPFLHSRVFEGLIVKGTDFLPPLWMHLIFMFIPSNCLLRAILIPWFISFHIDVHIYFHFDFVLFHIDVHQHFLVNSNIYAKAFFVFLFLGFSIQNF